MLATRRRSGGALGLPSSVATALLSAVRPDAGSLRADPRLAPCALTRELAWKLAAAGICGIALAWGWAAILPLNKSLWTPSFAVLTSGVATLCLVGAALLDQSPIRSGLAPFVWLGTNPLAVYFLSELTTDLIQIPWFTVGGHHTAPKDWFFWWVLAPRFGGGGGAWSSLIYALLYAVMWIGVAGMMRWRGVRFRV